MSGNTWTQGATEFDQISYSLTFTNPATCTSGGEGGGGFRAEILLDGVSIASVENDLEKGETETKKGVVPLFETGAPVSHTITVKFGDNCEGVGQHFTVKSFAADVVGAL